MRPYLYQLGVIFAASACWTSVLLAQEPEAFTFTPLATTQTETVSPLLDDATLHDIQFVGTKVGWAAGDRGVVWNTTDGGENWSLLPTPVNCPLRSVCFLTDQIGWVAGGETISFSHVGYGVVLFTEDGGKSWQQLVGRKIASAETPTPQTVTRSKRLPQLHYVKFFGIKQGIAVGATSPARPVGVFLTDDGGHTWHEAEGTATNGWRAASFPSSDHGVVAGLRGHMSLVAGARLIQPRVGDLGLRGLNAVTVQPDDTGWLVGDGGLILRTSNGGVVWEQPTNPLPEQLRGAIDFRAVTCYGNKMWCAGSPGSVVWHTPDDGKTWQKQPTGQTSPIRVVTFRSETSGWAAGTFGTILKTEDGGATWRAVRAGNRRAAMLSMHSRAEEISPILIVKQSSELGYRAVSTLVSRPDMEPDGTVKRDIDTRISESIVAAGGNTAEIGWELPLSIPGLERDSQKLIAEWNRRTEGRFRQVVIGKLVRQLRTWRPSVVVIDQPKEEDAAAQLLKEGVLQAVRLASDPLEFLEQQELARLGTWKVSRLYERLPNGSLGDITIDPFELLPRQGESISMAAASARGKLHSAALPSSSAETYQHVETNPVTTVDYSGGSDFFTGLGIVPGSDARRRLPEIREDNLERQMILARRQKNFRAYTERNLDDPRQASQLIAELNGLVSVMPDHQAALQLAQLANDYRAHSRWDLAESTLLELVRRYPDQPATADAMRWLMQLWCSEETAWQRSRVIAARGRKVGTNVLSTLEKLRRARELKGSLAADGQPVKVGGSSSLAVIEGTGGIQTGGEENWRQGVVRQWEEHALEMAKVIHKRAPELYLTPEIEFPLATVVRRRKAFNVADEVYFRYQRNKAGDDWRASARAEIWMNRPFGETPKTMALCRRTGTPPLLDGLLSDPCWVDAPELRLTSSDESSFEMAASDISFVMLAHDGRFLYIAASIPRHIEMPNSPVEMKGRSHDADLGNHDRISLFLDVDRDYATWYTLEIDQRGKTTDTCWDDVAWDPKWYVAADGDLTHWRVEAAIPIQELTPHQPGLSTVWSVGIARTLPAVGMQSWTHPHGTTPRPESFGLVKFQ